MTSSVFERLAGIGQFLADEILPEVAGDKRSDLRAAIKMLGDAAGEIDELPGLLRRECQEMLYLCEALAKTLGPADIGSDRAQALQRFAWSAGGAPAALSELEPLDMAMGLLLGDLVILLAAKEAAGAPDGRAGSRPLLAKGYEFLRRRGEARKGWQSVFAEGALYSRGAIENDQKGDG